RRKDEFLGRLVHDLRTPLAPVQTAIDILQLPAATAAQRDHALALLERQVNELRGALDALLDASRAARDKIDLRIQLTDLAAAVAQAVERSRPRLDERKLTLTVSLPAEPVGVPADAARLVQILTELLTNAAKFTGEGGR